jgi:hypothetical protein
MMSHRRWRPWTAALHLAPRIQRRRLRGARDRRCMVHYGVLAIEAFEFGLRRESILNPLPSRVLSPSGQSIDTSPATLVVDRLDRMLADEARAAGAHLHIGARDTSGSAPRCDDRRVGAPEGRGRVLACGASYVLQRRLGLGMPPLHAVGADGSAGRPARCRRAASATTWRRKVRGPCLSSAPGRLRGSASCASAMRAPLRAFRRTTRRWQIPVSNRRPHRARLLPLSPIPKTYVRGCCRGTPPVS